MKEEMSQFNSNQVMDTIEREDRIIKSKFAVSKIKGYIKESFNEVSSATAEAEASTGSTFSASASR